MTYTFDSIDAQDEQEIRALILEHSWMLDRGDVSRLAELYTPEGALRGLEQPLEGRAAIAEWSRRRVTLTDRVSRHVHVNVRLMPSRLDEITGSLITLLYRHDGGVQGAGPVVPFVISDYDDVYHRHEGQWLIHSRTMTRVFVDSARVDGSK